MLTLLRHMDLQQYMPRSYVIAATDKMGAAKANTFEAAAAAAQTASSQKQVSLVVDYYQHPSLQSPCCARSLLSPRPLSENHSAWASTERI